MLIKLFTLLGGLAGCGGVALGALSAHALRERLDPAALATLDTASKYLLIHALLLLLIALWLRSSADSLALKLAGVCVIAGIFLFCGGLTASVLSGIHQFAVAAPLGGTSFMVAWLACAAHALVKS